MSTMTDLKEAVAAYLEKQGAVDGTITVAYPPERRGYPLERPAIAVGFESVELSPGGLGGYWGENRETGKPFFGREGVFTLRFDLYAPGDGGSDGVHRLFEALCDALLLRENPFGFRKLWCGETRHNPAEGRMELTAFATLHGALGQADGSQPVTGFQVVRTERKEGCVW